VKPLIVIGLLIVGLFVFSEHTEKQRAEKNAARVAKRIAVEAACQADLICRAKVANEQARRRSVSSSTSIRSATGIYYYKGDACTDDCSGHISGFMWASKLGISKKQGCTGYSQSFIEGCIQYVSERISELENLEDDEEQKQEAACMSGRYGDC
jgi:hypothetical protein